MMIPDTGLMNLAIIASPFMLAAGIMPLYKIVKADYASIFVLVLIEYLIFVVAVFFGLSALEIILFLTGWGFVSVVTVITIIGADIRDALRTRAAPPAASSRIEAGEAK